jgi:1,5-anhydro-D-fructose reductase (1,5-anhydro-D-mannitol-forming)
MQKGGRSIMDTVKWLLVGAGDIATRRAGPALVVVEHSQVVAICDMNAERAAKLAGQLGVAAVYTDLAAALAQSGADAVYLATPQSTHIELSLQVLAAGKHLLCEKPLALSGAQCLPLLEAARRSDCVTSCSNYRRLSEQYKLTAAMLQRGEIGRLLGGWAVYASPYYNPGGAPIRRALGASRIKELGYYIIDIAHNFLGMPTEVMAQGSVLNPAVMNDVEEVATVVLRFPGGELFTIIFNCSSPGTRHELELFGYEGRIYWPAWPPHGNGPVVKITRAGTEEFAAHTDENWHLPMVEDYVDALLHGRQPVCTLESAAQTEFITDAIFRSMDSGRVEPVRWES